MIDTSHARPERSIFENKLSIVGHLVIGVVRLAMRLDLRDERWFLAKSQA
jgi:hypothetical protein